MSIFTYYDIQSRVLSVHFQSHIFTGGRQRPMHLLSTPTAGPELQVQEALTNVTPVPVQQTGQILRVCSHVFC